MAFVIAARKHRGAMERDERLAFVEEPTRTFPPCR
jgi:hypothetical protein